MKKDLNKVASELNQELLNGIFKKADNKPSVEEQEAFRKRRQAHRRVEYAGPAIGAAARIAAASAVGALIAGGHGAKVGAIAGAGLEGLGLLGGRIAADFAGGRIGVEQHKNDSSHPLGNIRDYIIPGYTAYKARRRELGRRDALENLLLEQSIGMAK